MRLRVAREGDEAVLEVADTGVGIAADDLRPHLHPLLARRPLTLARDRRRGIGLAIVRELVRAHDGRVDVDSTPGKGSRFRVVVRAIEAPSGRARLCGAGPTRNASNPQTSFAGSSRGRATLEENRERKERR